MGAWETSARELCTADCGAGSDWLRLNCLSGALFWRLPPNNVIIRRRRDELCSAGGILVGSCGAASKTSDDQGEGAKVLLVPEQIVVVDAFVLLLNAWLSPLIRDPAATVSSIDETHLFENNFGASLLF